MTRLMKNLLEILLEQGQPVYYEQNHFILREGQISDEVLFLKEGVVRHFVLDLKGNERTIRISRENDIFYSSIISYYTDEPTYINCQTLTPTQGVSWHKDQLETIFMQHKELDQFRYEQLTLFIIEKHKKELSLLTNTAVQRYSDFCKNNIDLFNRIPHHIIASYLNMTPETLSRIRSKSIS